MMRILVTNDDGIHAPGLDVMERIARELSDDVWVVAPEHDQSGLSHSLTLSDPLRLRRAADGRFAVRGTPTDCVIMAVHKVMPDRPDLVLSGVNAGQNVADDVTYSGTVAGAMEGTSLGIRSIALSQSYSWGKGTPIPWEAAIGHAPALIEKLMASDVTSDILYNVNFPNCQPDAVTGTEVTVLGSREHGLSVVERIDARGSDYYWLRFNRPAGEIAAGTDLDALQRNVISVTPLRLDLTAHDMTTPLRKVLA